MPLDYKGRLTYWWTGPNEASPDIERKINDEFWEAFKATYPNIDVDAQNLDYNQMLDKLRTALLGNAAPMVVRLQILGGVEFAAKGYFQELKPEDVGYHDRRFLAGRDEVGHLWNGKTYGVPTNNETMALHLERQDLQGRRPRSGKPAGDLGRRRRLFEADQGQAGQGRLRHGRQAERRQHAVPLHAARCGPMAAARSTRRRAKPDLQDGRASTTRARRRRCRPSYDMYVRDKSVPASALTNTQNENQDPFIAGQLGMMIAHPAEYAVMMDLAGKATGADKEVADAVVANMRYGLIPEGSGAPRRGVRRLEHARLQARICRWRLRRPGGQGPRLLLDRPGMVDQAGLDRLEPRQSAAASRPSG